MPGSSATRSRSRRSATRRAPRRACGAREGSSRSGSSCPGRKDPVALPPSSRALLLVQRIRDESHRFAIEFQRELRSKAGLVSILEELPGIGPSKRRALLRELGSLRAVRSASPERLAAVPGISARDAATLHRFFAALSSAERGREPSRPRAPRSKARARAIRFSRRGFAMRRLARCLRLLLALAPFAAGAEIYQWTDEQGRVHYTQDLNQVPPRHRSQAELRAQAPHRRRSPADLQPARCAGPGAAPPAALRRAAGARDPRPGRARGDRDDRERAPRRPRHGAVSGRYGRDRRADSRVAGASSSGSRRGRRRAPRATRRRTASSRTRP